MCFFFKQKTAYEMRISDWSSDVCSSDLLDAVARVLRMLADRPPPDVGGGPGDVARAIDQAWRLLRLPIEAKRDALDLFTRSAREVLDGFFESDALKAVFGFDAVVGNYASTRPTGRQRQSTRTTSRPNS